jgi:hypothetical protein
MRIAASLLAGGAMLCAGSAAADAPLSGMKGIDIGMPTAAAKAAFAKLGKIDEEGPRVGAEEILRTWITADGGAAQFFADLHDGKIVNLTLTRRYDKVEPDACKAKYEEKLKELTAQYGAFAQSGAPDVSPDLWVTSTRWKASLARDGRAVDLIASHAEGVSGLKWCSVSVELGEVAWKQQRRVAARF